MQFAGETAKLAAAHKRKAITQDRDIPAVNPAIVPVGPVQEPFESHKTVQPTGWRMQGLKQPVW